METSMLVKKAKTYKKIEIVDELKEEQKKSDL